MKILCITRAWGSNAGGMERLSFELINELKKTPGVAATIIANHTPAGASPHRARLYSLLFMLRVIPQALRAAPHSDVIHLGDPVLSLVGWLIQKLHHKPVAVTIHGLDVTYPNPLYRLYLRLFGKYDLCLPISRHAEKLLNKSTVTCRRCLVVNPGIHDRFYDPTSTRGQLVSLIKRRTNYFLPTTTPVLLTAGRLVPRKGQAWFIQTVLPYLPNKPLYLIAGTGPDQANIAAAAKKAGVSERVLLLGRINDDELQTLYNTVDAFIQPNIPIKNDAEGFGLVLLEAALCQRPVFAAHLEGISDAIHNEANGTLLPPQDAQAWTQALTIFLQSPRPQPSARRYTLQNFAWPLQTQKYVRALAGLTTTIA